MLRGGIAHILVLEVAFDPFGLFLDAAQGADGSTASESVLFWLVRSW
jgi:hypothetical protein